MSGNKGPGGQKESQGSGDAADAIRALRHPRVAELAVGSRRQPSRHPGPATGSAARPTGDSSRRRSLLMEALGDSSSSSDDDDQSHGDIQGNYDSSDATDAIREVLDRAAVWRVAATSQAQQEQRPQEEQLPHPNPLIGIDPEPETFTADTEDALERHRRVIDGMLHRQEREGSQEPQGTTPSFFEEEMGLLDRKGDQDERRGSED